MPERENKRTMNWHSSPSKPTIRDHKLGEENISRLFNKSKALWVGVSKLAERKLEKNMFSINKKSSIEQIWGQHPNATDSVKQISIKPQEAAQQAQLEISKWQELLITAQRAQASGCNVIIDGKGRFYPSSPSCHGEITALCGNPTKNNLNKK